MDDETGSYEGGEKSKDEAGRYGLKENGGNGMERRKN